MVSRVHSKLGHPRTQFDQNIDLYKRVQVEVLITRNEKSFWLAENLILEDFLTRLRSVKKPNMPPGSGQFVPLPRIAQTKNEVL
ncbi:hypothetical protein ANAPC5_01143 [Anaplasma phagocytophilum]|nr:hypothetical protein ANAPC5_01143 [Anaplasma phagocytophilum]